MNNTPEGFSRTEDGYLVKGMGRHYREPSEAIKVWRNGELKPGCNARIFSMWSSSPCGRTPKHDPDHIGRPTKCGIHCKAAEEKREEKKRETSAIWKAQSDARDKVWQAEKEIKDAIKSIAAGHNDPRSLAQEVLQKFEDAQSAINRLKGKET